MVLILNKENGWKLFLYDDDQILVSRSENDLQKAFYQSNTMPKNYNLISSAEKTKVIVFQCRYRIKSIIVFENQTVEEVHAFNYSG